MDTKIYLGAVAVFVVIVASGISFLYGMSAGYRAALHDYVSGNIECIIRVQYPELLKKSPPAD